MWIEIAAAATAVALICGVYAWRLARAERLRSDARVAALGAAIDGTAPDAAPVTMFGGSTTGASQGRPLLKVAVGFVAAVFVIVAIAMTGDRHAEETAAAPATSTTTGSLELLSMTHERVDDTLTVTGLVRNPAPTAPGDIMAVVFAFDREGRFVASGRAPLEFTTIAAGDESPFQVTVPDVKDVGRYRVSFRTAAGVVRHVDRRPAFEEAAAGKPALQASAQ